MAVLISSSLAVAAQTGAWKTEIDNSAVQVERRVATPHQTIVISESSPSLFVFLGDSPVVIAAGAHQERLPGRRGQCFWHSGGKIQVENPGEQSTEIVRVVPKFRPDPLYELPERDRNRIEFENELMRMRHIGPAATTGGTPMRGRLQHPASSVMIELASRIHIRLTHPSGRVEEIERKAGEIWFQPEDPYYGEAVEKIPDHEVLRIELKTSEVKP